MHAIRSLLDVVTLYPHAIRADEVDDAHRTPLMYLTLLLSYGFLSVEFFRDLCASSTQLVQSSSWTCADATGNTPLHLLFAHTRRIVSLDLCSETTWQHIDLHQCNDANESIYDLLEQTQKNQPLYTVYIDRWKKQKCAAVRQVVHDETGLLMDLAHIVGTYVAGSVESYRLDGARMDTNV
jgi:hypothetical protein